METMTVHLRVTEVGTRRILGVTVAVEDSTRGLREARWLAHGMAAAMRVEADRVDVLGVEL